MAVHAQAVEGQDAFRRLGGRDPIVRGDAPHAQPFHDKGGPSIGQAAAAGFIIEGPRQHRVVPVHGELDLGGEGGGMMGHRVTEATGRQLPVRPVLGQALGHGDGATQ